MALLTIYTGNEHTDSQYAMVVQQKGKKRMPRKEGEERRRRICSYVL
jgi:hypothetical protein